MTPPTFIYQPSQVGTCLSQGEILSDLVTVRVDPAKIGETETSIVEVRYSFAVVLTQACELEQDYSARQQGVKAKQLPEVLFCQVAMAAELKGTVGGSDIWKRIRQNKDERYHCLEKVPPECDAQVQGIPDIGIDFKRYFTIPTEEVYGRIEHSQTKRRCVLITPYQLHLSNRFAAFLCRVPLPREHSIG